MGGGGCLMMLGEEPGARLGLKPPTAAPTAPASPEREASRPGGGPIAPALRD